ncbi:MAG: hypothetical protein E6H66_10480 [Betaproteobacteria bacterium]|nr:MAG: hypothetical protein E6H66_10480 [Betaproteobacteria bacterium]
MTWLRAPAHFRSRNGCMTSIASSTRLRKSRLRPNSQARPTLCASTSGWCAVRCWKGRADNRERIMRSKASSDANAILGSNAPSELVLQFVRDVGAGVQVDANGAVKGIIKGDDFAKAFLSIWLGPEPPNPEIKSGLLGGACG